jgi:hypothetical protein
MPGISPQPPLIHETQHDPSLTSPDPEITQPRRTRSQTAAVVLEYARLVAVTLFPAGIRKNIRNANI